MHWANLGNTGFTGRPERAIWLHALDNAPHFTNITTFPDHKHIPVGVVSSKQRRLRDVIEEIEQEML
jgi:hypothetical protein